MSAARAVPRAARHRPGDDRRAGLRRPGVHGRRRGEDPRRARAAQRTSRSAARSTSTAGSTARRPEFVGGLGVDVLVVGSALFDPGTTWAARSGSIRALADEGYAFRLNDGKPPSRATDGHVHRPADASRVGTKLLHDDRGRWHPGRSCSAPTAQMNPDGVRDYEPAWSRDSTVEQLTALERSRPPSATRPMLEAARGGRRSSRPGRDRPDSAPDRHDREPGARPAQRPDPALGRGRLHRRSCRR